MRPVRVKSCSTPFLSMPCWAMVSPVAIRTPVVTHCVRMGRRASTPWYLKTAGSAASSSPYAPGGPCAYHRNMTGGDVWRRRRESGGGGGRFYPMPYCDPFNL